MLLRCGEGGGCCATVGDGLLHDDDLDDDVGSEEPRSLAMPEGPRGVAMPEEDPPPSGSVSESEGKS